VELEQLESEIDGHKTTRTQDRHIAIQLPVESSRINVWGFDRLATARATSLRS